MSQHLTSQAHQQTLHRTVLANGIAVIAIENSAADIIATRIFVRVGSQQEPLEKAGLTHLLASTITKGTQELSAIDIAEQIESVGAQLSADAASDYFLLSLKTVAADWFSLLELAAQMLRSPSFPDNEVELERSLAIQGIRAQKEQPFNVAFEQLRTAMYPGHPYGISILGTEATTSQLTPTDLQHYHHTYFRPDNLVIAIAGRITPEVAFKQVEQVFGDWQPPEAPLIPKVLPSLTAQPRLVMMPQQTQQTIVMLGYLAAPIQDPDYITLKLLNTYLGNGLSSRLFVELREKRGLAYDVSAFYPSRQSTSIFVAYMGTAPENTETALIGLRTEVERLRHEQLSNDDLQRAKNKLLGQYALGKQTNAQLAQIYGWYETLGLGIDFDNQFQQQITSVTPEMAQDVAQRYFWQPYVSLVGPAEIIQGLESAVV